MTKNTDKDLGDIDFDQLDANSQYPLDEVFGGAGSSGSGSGEYNNEQNLSSKKPLKNPRENPEEIESPLHLEEKKFYFFPTWRSQLLNLIWFHVSGIGAIWVSREMPQYFILPGKLFSTESTEYVLYLPLLIFVPAFFLVKVLINIYNSVYCFDNSGIEAHIGLVSFNLRQPRLRWEDIRGVEPSQNIWERMLSIGTVKVGSAMSQETEIIMTGVSSPREIQELINSERAKRLKELKQSGTGARHGAVTGD